MEPNSPPSSNVSELTEDGILDILNADDDAPEITDKDIKDSKDSKDSKTKTEDLLDENDTEKKDKEDSEDEEVEIEEEIKDEELDNLTSIPRRKEILAKYPKLFKDFPALETAYYREQKYAEILPTIEDARDAKDKAETLSKFEGDLFTGNNESVLRALKEADSDAFGKLVDNYLPSLQKVDPVAWQNVMGNVIRSCVAEVFKEGTRLSNDDVKNAAVILNQVLLGTSEFTAPRAFGKVENPANNEIKNEREQFLNERYVALNEDLGSRIQNSLISTIDKHIDPKNEMSEYVKRTAIREAFGNLDKLLAQDSRFTTTMKRLWDKSRSEKYSRNSAESIRNTYLSMAKTVLPKVIQNARNEALKGSGRRSNVEVQKEDKKGRLPVGRSALSSTSKSNNNDKQSSSKGMSAHDYIMSDD